MRDWIQHNQVELRVGLRDGGLPLHGITVPSRAVLKMRLHRRLTMAACKAILNAPFNP
jgi:hypothetical protein